MRSLSSRIAALDSPSSRVNIMTRVPRASRSDLIEQIERTFTHEAATLTGACVDQSQRHGVALYLVGGALRDLLRGQPGPMREIDLVVEGEVEAIARAAAQASKADLTLFPRFLTARLRLGSATVDLASARRERYPEPAASPVVRPAAIEADLPRRDFSVNAVALALTSARRSELLDPCGGLGDLRARRIRVLHTRSFIHDPARLLRACRYAARLEGRLSRETMRLLRRDASGLQGLSQERFGAEWRRLLEDKAADGALRRAVEWGLTEAAVPGWRPAPRLRHAWARLGGRERRQSEHFWALHALVEESALTQRAATHCALRRKERQALERGLSLRQRHSRIAARALAPSAAATLLRGEPESVVEAAAALWTGRAGERVRRYLAAWRDVESPLSAADLAALGLCDAALGTWRAELRDAVLDGELSEDASGWSRKQAARKWVRQKVRQRVG